MAKHTSLTAPWDVEEKSTVVGHEYEPTPLTNKETESAMKVLVNRDDLTTFREMAKYYADPIYNNQVYCLHSFVPSKGAQPDEHGVYGFMKCRGAFHSVQEANQRAEDIIRNVDSYHRIQTSYCGKPFPVCSNSEKYAAEIEKVDMKKKSVETVSEDVREKRRQEKKEMEEIKDREKKLLEQSGEDFKEDPIDTYTTLRVKKANLTWTYLKTQEKLAEIKESIVKCRQEVVDMDSEFPDFKNQYYDKYMEARRASGLSDDQTADNFIKYMVEDAELDF